MRLNRAAAIAERDGPRPGWPLVDAIDGLDGFPLLARARADLLDRLGRPDEAAPPARQAALPLNDAQRSLLGRGD